MTLGCRGVKAKQVDFDILEAEQVALAGTSVLVIQHIQMVDLALVEMVKLGSGL